MAKNERSVETMTKKGRPRMDEKQRKTYQYRLRMNFKEKTMLNRLKWRLNKPASEILMIAMKQMYEKECRND